MKNLTETLSIQEMESEDSDYDALPRVNNLDGENGEREPGMCVICLANITHPIGAPLSARGVSNLLIVLKISLNI